MRRAEDNTAAISRPGMRLLLRLILGLYLLFLLYITLFLFPNDRPYLRLVPFESIVRDWRSGGTGFVVNLVGNIVAFMPIGVLMPIIRTGKTGVGTVLVACAAFSGSIEVLQFLFARRVADIDDLLLNTLGGVLGYLIVIGVRAGISPSRRRS